MMPVLSGVTVTPAYLPMRYTTAVASWLANATEISGSSQSTGLRYVSRSSTATTTPAARNSVVSVPPTASSPSESAPAEPVTAVSNPAGVGQLGLDLFDDSRRVPPVICG